MAAARWMAALTTGVNRWRIEVPPRQFVR